MSVREFARHRRVVILNALCTTTNLTPSGLGLTASEMNQSAKLRSHINVGFWKCLILADCSADIESKLFHGLTVG